MNTTALGQRLAGKTVVITGAARGQGEAEARLCAEAGASVLLCDVRDDEGRSAAAKIGPQAAYVHLNVAEEDEWDAALGFGRETFGHLDVLVNNAGIAALASIEEQSADDFMRVVRINQLGPWLGMKKILPALRETGAGSIVNVSSIGGLVGLPRRSAYVGTKFALTGMTKSAALEFAPYGIRVNSIHPGAIDTPMMREFAARSDKQSSSAPSAPLGRFGLPEEVARVVVFLASDESSYCTGAEFLVDGGVLAGVGGASS